MKTAEKYVQDTYMQTSCSVIFTQMSVNAGFKKYGPRAIAAMIKEFTQLNEGAVPGKPVVAPVGASSLTDLEKRQALQTVNLIKEKYNGEIKGRKCADGSKQK